MVTRAERVILLPPLLLMACASGPRPLASAEERTRLSTGEAQALLALESSAEPAPSVETRREHDWQQAQALERAGLLSLAAARDDFLARDVENPHRDAAIEALVRLSAQRDEELLSATMLERLLSERPAALSPQASARASWLRTKLAVRVGQLDQALAQSEQVPSTSPYFAQTQYLRGLALADPRGSRSAEAAPVFERLAKGVPGTTPEQTTRVQGLSLLALGRLAAAAHHWADAARWDEQAARFEAVRAEAKFERGVALLQQGDLAGALASFRDEVVRALTGEARLLEAIALHWSGDAAGARAALEALRGVEAPVRSWTSEDALRALRTGQGAPASAIRAVKANRRLASVLANADAVERERQLVRATPELMAAPLGGELLQALDAEAGMLREMAGTLARSEFQRWQAQEGFARDAALLVGVEVALAQRDLDGAVAYLEETARLLPSEGPVSAELLLRLAAVRRARAEVLSGAAAEDEWVQVRALVERIAAVAPGYERLADARALLER